MKKLFIMAFAMATLPCAGLTAQDDNGSDDNDRAEMAKEFITKQAERMAKSMDLDEAKTNTFTDLYVEYRTEAMKLRTQTAATKGAKKKSRKQELTDAQADSLIQARFTLEQKELELKKTYYEKFRKEFTPAQLVRVFTTQPRNNRNTDRTRNRPQMPGGPMGGFGGPGGGMGPGGF